jgi:aromatic ring-cleaving dioxygenase
MAPTPKETGCWPVLRDNPYDDHSRYAVWLGSPVALKLSTMRRGYRPERYPTPR